MKPLNSLVVMSWHTPGKCVRVLVGTTSIQLSEDNHDSWVTCTTSTECKTVITAMLTVMSGMDPHMIRWNQRWVWLVGRSGSYYPTPAPACHKFPLYLRVATISLLNLSALLFRWIGGWKFGMPAGSRRRLLGRPLLRSMPVEAHLTLSLPLH
jgi:hypothetical protein